MLNPLVSIVIPTRRSESVEVTMRSLMRQTLQNFAVHVVVDHEGRGAPWARNRGAECARGTYLLFSDNDIEWEPDALETMVRALEGAAGAEVLEQGRRWAVGYVYGGYWQVNPVDGTHRTYCLEPWRFDVLQKRNFISTMTLMVRGHFPGFDESLGRLQDWDLWLTLAERGTAGQAIERVLFTTWVRNGITFGGAMDYDTAWRVVRHKHHG